MTEFNLGVLSAYATINDAPFNAKYPRLVAKFRALFAESTKGAGGVDKLDASLAAVADSSAAASAGLSRVGTSTTRAGAAQAKAAASAKVFADAQERVNATMAQYAGASARVQAAALRVAAAEDRLNAVMVSETATTRQLAAAQAGLIGATRSLATAQKAGAVSGGRFAASMGAAGKTLTRHLSVPLLLIGVLSGKAATDFSASMTRIQTQAGASAGDVKILTRDVLAMKGAQQGPNDLAGALYHLKSVGLANVPAMKALRASSDLAAVGNANLEDTTNALAGAWRSGIKGAGSFAHTAATVNAIIGAGNMTLSDFTQGLSTGILPAARTFGVSLQSIGAALSVFTDEGVPAEVALTRMRMSLSLLGAPTDKATRLLDGIGISSTQLAKDMRSGPNGLLNAITDLKDHLSGLSKVAQAQFLSQAFGGGRSSSAIMTMINQTDLLGKKWDQVTGSISKYGDAVKTQQATPQAQFKVALANLEKAGVLLGNQLLPIAIQFAHAITGLATGFNGLSDGAKHFAVEVGIGLLVLGPMLSLVGKLGRAIAVMWAAGRGAVLFAQGMRAATLSTEAMTSSAYLAGRKFSSMGVAATRAASAVAGIGVGVSIGLMTRDSSQLTKGLGVLAATAAGLAIGGPLGALGGLVGSLAGAFAGGSQSAAAGAAELSTAIDGLTGTLNQNTGAVTKATTAWIAHDLATTGALDKLGALGITYQTATAAALGNKAAADQVRKAMFANMNAFDGTRRGAALAAGEILKLATALGVGTHHIRQQNTAQNAMKQGAIGAAAASHAAEGAMHTEAGAALNLTQSLKQMSAQYLKTTNAALGIRLSELQFLDSLHSLSQAIKDSNGSLSEHTAKGRAAQEALLGLAQSADQADKGTRKGNAALLDQIKTLRAHAIQAGADKGTVDALLGSMNLLPRQINMRLNVDTGTSMQKLIDIQNQVNRMHGKTLFVGVAGGHTLPGSAGGRAQVPEGVSAVGERGTELLVKDGPKLGVVPHGPAMSFLRATGARIQGFAGGTHPSPITTTQSGGKKVWVYAGIEYASLSAARNARTRAEQAKPKAAVSHAGSLLSGVTGSPGSPQISGSGFNWNAFAQQMLAASNAISRAVAAGASKSAIAGLNKRLDRLRAEGRRAERRLGHTILGEAAGIGRAAESTSTTRSGMAGQLAQLEADLRRAGLPKQFIAGLAKDNKAIEKAVQSRNRAAAHLAAANQAVADARKAMRGDARAFGGAVTGSFDITSAGQDANGRVSRGGIMASSGQAVTRARAFVAGMKKLIGMHVFPGRYLRQLLGEGPSALAEVQALAGMPRADIVKLAQENRQLNKLGQTIGGLGAHRLDQGAVDAAQKRAEHYRKLETKRDQILHDDLQNLGDRIEHKLETLHLLAKLDFNKGQLALAAQAGAAQNAKATRSTPPRPGGRG